MSKLKLFLLICCCLVFVLRELFFVDKIRNDIKINYYRFDGSRKPKKILIIAEARSGSSFLGDLLQHSTSSSYYGFEPLIGINQNSSLYQELLFKLFNCKFDDYYLKPIFWKIYYMKWNRSLVKFINKNYNVYLKKNNDNHGHDDDDDLDVDLQYFNKTIHEIICGKSSIIVIKTIRFTLNDFFEIQKFRNNDIKLIFLVRDPRAVMNSRINLSWCVHQETCIQPKTLCNRMRDNIETFKLMLNDTNFSNSIMLIRYEDLIGNIFIMAKELLKFLNIKANLDGWLEKHTSMDDTFSNPHSTYRNIKTIQAANWQQYLTDEELIEIEDECADVMDELGYYRINEPGQSGSMNQYDRSIFELMSNNFSLKLYSTI